MAEANAEGRLYRSIGTVDGLTSSGFTTYAITRTPDGFTWFATDRGLIRFDGEHAVMVSLPSADGATPSVKAISPAPDGSLIVSASNGVFGITQEASRISITNLHEGRIIPANCSITVPGVCTLFGGNDGLVAFMPDGSVKRITVGRDVLDPSNRIIDMAQGEDGIYILAKGGDSIYLLDTKSFNLKPIESSTLLESHDPTALAVSGDHIYIGTSGDGIHRYDISSGRHQEVFPFSRGNVVTDLEISHDGSTLYAATDGGGIAKIDLPSEKIISIDRHIASDPTSPVSNQVYSLFADEKDLLWVGYYQNGAQYTPAWTGPFQLEDNPAVFNTRDIPVRALSFSDGRITIGTRDGLVVFERNCSTAYTLRKPELRSELVISLFDHNGKIYIGTYGGGMQILDPSTRHLSDIADDGPHSVFRSGHIFSIASDKEGNLWTGTSQGLFKMDPTGKRTRFTSANSQLPDGNVYGIFFDSEGKGWICTDNGLCIYDPRQKKIRTDIFPKQFPHTRRFRTVYEDSHGRLHFIPETGMAFSTNLDLSDMKDLSHHLLDGADAKGIVEDSKGDIWLTTNRGVFRIDSLDRVIRFGLAAGLPAPSFLQGQPIADSKGHIWFGNSAGLLRLTEKDIDTSINAQRPPVPTTLKINGSKADFASPDDAGHDTFSIVTPAGSTTLEIGFSTLSYALEEPDDYLYSLDNREWKHFPKDFSLTFYDLAPGKHLLRVKSANDPDEDPQITKVNIHVPYPTWWFILAISIIALVVCATISIAVVTRHRRKSREMAAASFLPSGATADSNGQLPTASSGTDDEQSEASRRKKYASNTLSRTEAREIARKIDEIMDRDKPYLKPDLKVGDLATLAGISSHRMSQFFSQHKGVTFYDHINAYRVEEFKRIAKTDARRNLTLTAMSEKAGFSSRASFFRYFKNTEGISPGEWLKNLDQ